MIPLLLNHTGKATGTRAQEGYEKWSRISSFLRFGSQGDFLWFREPLGLWVWAETGIAFRFYCAQRSARDTAGTHWVLASHLPLLFIVGTSSEKGNQGRECVEENGVQNSLLQRHNVHLYAEGDCAGRIILRSATAGALCHGMWSSLTRMRPKFTHSACIWVFEHLLSARKCIQRAEGTLRVYNGGQS